jgi:hypothetical protein
VTGVRVFALSIAAIVFSTPVLCAQDLSRYRDYQLGMSLAAVAKQAGMNPSDARVLQQRPKRVEELEWRSQDGSSSSAPQDSARRILFRFYDGQLFRIVVSYDWDRTEGLTIEDVTEAVSATYGLATLPAIDLVSSVSRAATTGDEIVAHWEDQQYALDLFRPSYTSTFGLTLFSKRSDVLAQAADAEGTWVDERDTAARAIERQRTQESERQARQEQARRVNRAAFRP